jgi:hypothetical protein
MICSLDANNYCERHRRVHDPGELRLALDPSARGEQYRRAWDAWAKINPQSVPAMKLTTRSTIPGTCKHRSTEKIGLVTCPKCKNKSEDLDVFECFAGYKKCTEMRRVDDHGCCRGCELRVNNE